VPDDCAEPAEIPGRHHDLTARCDHVFDDEQPAACDLGSLGELRVP